MNYKFKKYASFSLIFFIILLTFTGCYGNLSATKQESVAEPNEFPEGSTFQARFINVGQGDSVLIECDQHYLLIDGGSASYSDKIYRILKEQEITHLDIIVATHPDEDHVAGLAGALNYASASITLCSSYEGTSKGFDDFLKYAQKNGGKIMIPEIGDTYQLGSATVTILGIHAGTESNDSSIVLKIQYGQTSFLFTGDAEYLAEQALMDGTIDLSSTVLKVAHHGSSDSSSEAFLNQVCPKYAIISVGKDNPYLHPSKTVLRRLSGLNTEIYRTDLQGDILISSNGTALSITTEKSATKEQLLTSGREAADDKNQIPQGTDFVLNKNTYKFHQPNCKNIDQMKEINKIYFEGTKEELLKNGYDPCGYCKP